MQDTLELFTPNEWLLFQQHWRSAIRQARTVPLMVCYAVLQAITLGFVLYIEWEIVYRVFDYLSPDHQYWQPGLMGLTAAIMILAFHLLANEHPRHPLVRLLKSLVGFLIVAYVIGVGLLLGAIINAEGLLDLIRAEAPEVIGQLPTDVESPTGAIDWLFSQITNPAAALAFSLGMGGLSIVNLFVAHGLFVKITDNAVQSFARLQLVKHASQAYFELKRATKTYSSLGQDLADATLQSGHYHAQQLAAETLNAITEALLPHRKYVKEAEYATDNRFLPGDHADPKQVAKDITKIEAITYQKILDTLTPSIPKD